MKNLRKTLKTRDHQSMIAGAKELNDEKVKKDVFVGPQIKKLTKDLQFLFIMINVEKKTFLCSSSIKVSWQH